MTRKLARFPIHDQIARRQAPLLLLLLFFLIATSGVRLVFFLDTDRASIGTFSAITIDSITFVCPIIAFFLLLRGFFFAATLLTALEILLTIGIAAVATGLRHSGMLPLVFALPIILTGLLIDWRGLVVVCAASCAIVIGIAILESQHSTLVGFAPSPEQPASMASIFVFVAILLCLLLSRFRIDYRRELEEHRRTEATLRQSQARSTIVFQASPAPMSITRMRDGSFIDVNASYERLFGYARDELIGTQASAADIYTSTDERASIVQIIHEQGRLDEAELTLRTKSGELRTVLCSLESLEIDSETCILAIVFDITERVRAETALRASEERFHNVFVANPSPKLITRANDRTITDANPAFARMTGYSLDQLIGQTTDALGLWPESPLITEARTQLRQAQQLTNQEIPIRTRDGSIRDLLLSVVPIMLDGEAYFLTVMLDQTDRKLAETALTQQAEELTRSNTELQQFAYVASHDLQEPLRMVASYTQLLARRYRGKLDADADEFIAYAVDGAMRMQTLINDLLAYSRVGSRSKPFEPIDCALVVEQACANLKLVIEENAARVTHDPLPMIQVDASQLTQVFQNLISNAIKFRSTDPPQINIAIEQCAAEWVFMVSDNGIGIDPQYAERIFIIFQRLHTRTEYPGTGIGLAICKKIVERHGGQIWVEPLSGPGSRFVFTLPYEGERHR